MLPPAHRLTAADSFRRAVRHGQRAGSSTLVAHLWTPEPGGAPVRVGLVVGKAVGNAVVRNRVKRRLRHLAAPRLAVLPDSAVLVLRALPAAADATYDALAADLDRCLRRLAPRPVPA